MERDSQGPVGATGVQKEQQQQQWPVIVVSCFFIVAGIAGIVYHVPEWRHEPFSHGVWPLVVRLLAIVCGVFMLMRKNWARYLAVVWLAYHVVLSAFHSVAQTVFHLVLQAVIAWVLFRREAGRWFGATA